MLLLLVLIPFSTINALELAPNASSTITLEPTTGKIIYERNSHERRHPASMTKIMTMLLVMESIESGNLSFDDTVRVSANASSMGGSQILLETGEEMSVYDLFKGMAVASGNDAAVALAEKVAGSEEEFVKKMNEKAKELGLTDTNFKNCHGLDDANHYSSAYDMAMIAKELVKHEKVFEFTKIYEDYLRKGTDRSFWLVNTNKLVRFYKGVDGLKTGYTSEAGYCVTATALIDGMRIITVVMGEPDSKTRNSDVTSGFDYVYSQYSINEVINTDTVLTKSKVSKGVLDYVDIVAKDKVVDLYKKSDGVVDLTYDINLNLIKAPVKSGDIVGYLTLSDGRKVDLTVKEDVKKSNIFLHFYKYLKKVIN